MLRAATMEGRSSSETSTAVEDVSNRSILHHETAAIEPPVYLPLQSTMNEDAGGALQDIIGDGVEDEEDELRMVNDEKAEGENAAGRRGQLGTELANVDSLLVAGEEVPPSMEANYMEAMIAADPRVAFDALHIGALVEIERREALENSLPDYSLRSVPSASYIHRPSQRQFFFTVPALHPHVRRRSPIRRDDGAVDDLRSAAPREKLLQCIGPDTLARLQRYRREKLSIKSKRRGSSHKPH